MVFSTSFFLTFILPVLLILYFLTDRKYKNYFLVIFSCFFYAWGAPRFIFVILATTLIDFYLVKFMNASEGRLKRRVLLFASVIINVGLLFYFKYCHFFIDTVNDIVHAFGGSSTIGWTKLVFPIGISFYTFETITYVVDVYRKVHAPLTRFTDYLLYIILFPKLIAGPIIRYHEISDQLTDRRANDNADNKLSGFYIFCVGLAKKVLIADTMGHIADSVYGQMGTGLNAIDPSTLSTGTAWIAALAYTFQIYFDFSGYSNMAIGLGKLLGFIFPENFNSPYISESITEFWRRWHITLGNWMRNYLYIPLGGNKVSAFRLYFNLWIVFILSGFWHGASWNFILWGVWHGLFLVLERSFLLKVTAKLGKVPRMLLTFLIVVIGWVLFRVENLPLAFKYIASMFSSSNLGFVYKLNGQEITIGLIAVFFSWFAVLKPLGDFQYYFFQQKLNLKSHFYIAPICILLFILSLASIADNSFNSFIYFRF